MSDINANIGVNFDTAQALAELKNLQRQISTFHTSISRSSESAAIAQKNYQTNLLNAINATGQFVAQMGVIKTSTETFTHALENNKLSMREYYRYAGGATKTFGRLFTNEFNTIAKVAEERVKRLQTQYIKMGRDTTGAMRAMAVMPANLDMSNQSTKLQIAAQKQAIFNQLLKQGSTQLLNFGKNTQWAGRQLMVGFTVPLMAFGSSAVRAFQDIETAVIKFRKVYGDLGTTQQQTDAALNQIKDLAQAYTQYGVAVKDTIGLASDAAAAGYQNADLIAQTTSATKLSVLGQIDNQQALKTTISLQSAFNISAKELSGTIDFLNAVENQTVVSLDDLTAAIPIASPVMKQLGGTVKDLAFFLTAMKEGGVSATQGANALKSGLASLINPTKKASDLLATVGINIGEIVTKNKGDLKNTVLDFAKALDTLDPLSRARAIEVMFGKFQFARMSTLFQNITKDGSQASRVLGLMGMSAQDLASITNKELGVQGASALTKFKGAIEKLKATLAPVGELFMKIFTPIMDTISKLLDKFNHLSDGVKKTIGVIVAVVGGLGPIALMTFGLLSNAFANAVKFIATLRTGYQHLTGRSKDLGQQTNYLTTEQMDAAAAAHSLDQSHAKLTQTFTAEANAVSRLRGEYARALLAANEFALANPGMMMPGSRKKFATGGVVRGPGTGTSDSIPAMVSNGESIIPAKQTKKYGSLINAIINNQVPGFATGKPSITGGQSVLLSGLGFMAPGNVASGFGMSRSFFSQGSGFIDSMLASLAGGAFTLGKAGGSESRKLTANVMDAYEKELQQYAEQIVATLRQTAVNMGGVENSSLTLSKVVEASKNDLAPIFNRMKQSGNKAALAAEAVEKHGFFPTVAEMGGVMGETRAGSVREGEKASDVSMRRISTGKSKFQNAVMKFWNRSAAKYEELANQTVTYAHANEQRLLGPVLPFTGRGMAPGVLDSAEQQRLMGLVNLKGSAAAQAYSSTELRSAVRLKGQKDAAAYEASVQQNTQDIYMASRDRKSPHPQAAKDGVDDANAYNSAVAREAKKRRYASSPGGTVGPGGVIITGNMAGETPAQGRKLSMSLEGLNRAVMGTTFGLSALGSLGSMVGGVLGTLSAQVAKYSGLLFALMTVTQLVTQTKMAELVAERVSVASNAMRAVNIASFASKGTGVAGIGARLAQVGFGISKFLGPIGWGITAMTALVGVIKLVNAAKERERQAIEGLGKAANISAGQIAKLGQAFGVTPFKGSAETAKGYIPLNKEQRSLVTQARDALSGDKAYQQDVAALKGASTSQAKMMLQARSTKLLGAGFAKDQVQAIINAMLEDAGKQKIKFVVDSIDVTTKDGQAGIAKTAQTLINDYKKAFAKGYSKTTVNYDSYGQKGSTTYETLSKDLKTKLATAGQEYSSFFIGLQDQFQSGQIKAKDFTTSMQALLSSMSGLSSEQSGKLFTEILKGLNTEWPKAVGTVGTLSDQLLILQGAVSGLDTNQLKTLADALRVLEDPKSAADAIAKAKATIEGIKGQMGKNVSDQSVANNTNGTKTLDLGGTTTKSPYQTAVDQIKANTAALVNQVKAYNILRKAKMDEKTASDMAADSSIAEAFANAKNAKELSAVLALVKKYNAERIKAAGKGISTESGNIQQQLSAYAKLKAAGVDAAGAADLIQNADYSQYINSLKKGSAEWKSAVADAKKLLDLKNQLAHPDMGAGAVAIQTQIDSMLQKFQDQKSAADAYFAAQEQAVNQKYASSLGTPGIKGADQIAVDAAQSQVDAVQKLISAEQY
jgi:TP901 family phage tail tape measure protein